MKMFAEKVLKDYGTPTSLWYCSDKNCDNLYNKDELLSLDHEGKIIWGRIHENSKSITPICSNHGTFLQFMEDTPTPTEVTLM